MVKNGQKVIKNGQKWSKKYEYFLIRIFWNCRDPPPFLTEREKKQFFMPPLSLKIFDGDSNLFAAIMLYVQFQKEWLSE